MLGDVFAVFTSPPIPLNPPVLLPTWPRSCLPVLDCTRHSFMLAHTRSRSHGCWVHMGACSCHVLVHSWCCSYLFILCACCRMLSGNWRGTGGCHGSCWRCCGVGFCSYKVVSFTTENTHYLQVHMDNPLCASGHVLVSACSGSFVLVPAWFCLSLLVCACPCLFVLVPACLCSFMLVPAHLHLFVPVPPYPHSSVLVPAHPCSFMLVPAWLCWFPLVVCSSPLVCACLFMLVPTTLSHSFGFRLRLFLPVPATWSHSCSF